MRRSPLTETRVSPDNIQRFADQTTQALLVLQKHLLFEAQLLENLQLTTTAKSFKHNLGRIWRGYIVTSNSNGLVVFDQDNHNKTHIELACRALTSPSVTSTTISILIF